MSLPARFYITCPKGVESLLSQELERFELQSERVSVGGVYCSGDFDAIYAFCLYSRLANRVLWIVEQGKAESKDVFYSLIKSIPWQGVFSSQKRIVVDFKGSSRFITHSRFGAQLVKDGIVDHFVEAGSTRPTVDFESPDIRISVHLKKQRVQVGIDLTGQSLHMRGFRLEGAKAPLKENLAAALAMRAGVTADDHRYLIDPLCGSGTLLIESLLLRLDLPANVDTASWCVRHLLRFNPIKLKEVIAKAQKQYDERVNLQGILATGYDEDARSIEAAQANAERAGIGHLVEFKHRALKDFSLPKPLEEGLLLTNPPYGQRLGNKERLYQLYKQLGALCLTHCQGFDVAILTSEESLIKALGLQKSKSYQFYNGPIEVRWSLHKIYKKETTQVQTKAQARFDEGVAMIKNRLSKKQKQLKKWINNEQIEAYRLYDADMPEYAFALDIYGEFVHVSEYKAPKQIDPFMVDLRRQQFMAAVQAVLDVPEKKIIIKERKQQKGAGQYEKISTQSHFFPVQEHGVKVLVNLYDYLDTGLFLDHRPVRKLIGELASGKRFLNLFAYTSVATLHAAKGSALSSVSVDMSKTYQNWSLRNFRANQLDLTQHQLVNENCLTYLDTCKEPFDLIFLDPPSFSNSKKMKGVLDIQKDHESLIDKAMNLLADDGVLIFSNNKRGFRLADTISNRYKVEDIHRKSIDPDFEKRGNIHQCWLMSKP